MPPAPRLAFLLNLDAELELEAPERPHDVFAALERGPERAAQLGALIPPGAVVVTRRTHLPEATAALAWCPTPRAIGALRARGAQVTDAPTLDVLRLANDRALEARLPPALPHARVVRDRTELEDALGPRPDVERWLLKRGHAHRGRGRRSTASLDAATLAFAERSFELGALMVQPHVERTADFALHGHVGRERFVLGRPTRQELNRGGAWLGTRVARPGELEREELDALVLAASEVADLLRAIGYVGPFGVDAFRYRWGRDVAFCPRCEINARYSMGWATGMGELRPDLPEGWSERGSR